jgi:hypothetical protein
MCGYPPFGAQVILNGHEWVERLARRKRVVAVKNGNCFIEGSNFSEISRLAAELNRLETIARLRKLCEQWIYSTCLCFALPNVGRERSGFAYQYSVFQLELSRNLLSWRGTTMYGSAEVDSARNAAYDVAKLVRRIERSRRHRRLEFHLKPAD